MQLIFLPGASGSTSFWQPVQQRLVSCVSDRFKSQKVVAYPSFGHVPAHADVYDFASLTEYVLGQIQQECIIIAQSMGGIFAVQAALQKPDLVKGLVLLATSGGINLKPFQVQDWRSAYQQQYLNYPDWFCTARLDYSLQLQTISQPVLLLWGEQDPISPITVGAYLQSVLPQSKLRIVLGGDHLFAEKYPDQSAKFIAEYLAEWEAEAC